MKDYRDNNTLIEIIETIQVLKVLNKISIPENFDTLDEEIYILSGLQQLERKNEVIKKIDNYYYPILKEFHNNNTEAIFEL